MIPKETCEKLKEQGAKYWDKGLNPLIFDCSCEVGENCWAKKLINRNLPGIQRGWFPKRLDDVSLTGKSIVYFVQHLCDIAHPSLDGYALMDVKNIIKHLMRVNSSRKDPHHFLILTKYPENLYKIIKGFARDKDILFHSNGIYIGTSVTGKSCVLDKQRLKALLQFKGFKKWVSWEPIYAINSRYWPMLQEVDQIIVGAETGGKFEPPPLDWFRIIISECEIHKVPFFLKQIDSKGNRELDGQTHNTLIWRKT